MTFDPVESLPLMESYFPTIRIMEIIEQVAPLIHPHKVLQIHLLETGHYVLLCLSQTFHELHVVDHEPKSFSPDP